MSKILYTIKQALQQLLRNKTMGLTSILAIMAMLLILGLFFVMSVNVNLFSAMIRQDYNYVEVFLKDDITQSQQDSIISSMESIDGVKEVKYRDKTEAMQIMKKRWGDSGYLLDSLGDNPLPNSVLVNVKDVKDATYVTDSALKMEGVESIKYYKDTVDKLTKATNFLQLASLIIMAFLIVVSVVVVSNTIKLTVFARSKEISIMKYVGATSWFVRGPFLVEGMALGFIASMLASLITWAVYSKVVDFIGDQTMTILSSPLVSPAYMAGNLMVIFLALGLSVGSCGSLISMRKFLNK